MVKEFGSVRAIREEREIIIEWKINDFLRLRSNESYFSPAFDLSGARGWLGIHLRGQKRDTPFEYADLTLVLTPMPEHCENVAATFSLKTADGRSDLEKTAIFDERHKTFYIHNFICRSDLMKRESELLPSGALTAICTLEDSGPNAVSVDDVPISSVSTERQFLETAQTEGATVQNPAQESDTSSESDIPNSETDDEEVSEDDGTSLERRVALEISDGNDDDFKGKEAAARSEIVEKTDCFNSSGFWELQKNLHEILLSGDISDVILKVDDQEFKAHRCILAARSPVFRAMMSNEMKENLDGVVDIKDIDSKIFSDFLNYLYTGSTKNLTAENAAKLYTAADKYQVEVLKKNCLDYMLTNVSVENFCDVLMLSVQHNEEELKEICIQYFGKHLLDIIQTCKWQTFLTENPIVANELHIKHIQLNKDIYALLSKK